MEDDGESDKQGLAKVDVKLEVSEEVQKEAMDFLKRVGGPIAEGADFLSDKIRFLRWQSAVNTLKKAGEFSELMGMDPKQVPIKFLVPWLEGCSLEEEDSPLSDLWAALLARASGNFDPSMAAYQSILKQIGPGEAHILQLLWNREKPHIEDLSLLESGDRPSNGSPSEEALHEGRLIDELDGDDLDPAGRMILRIYKKDEIEGKVTVEHSNPDKERSVRLLEALGLVSLYGIGKAKFDAGYTEFVHWATLTNFGILFISACEPPSQ